jgi:hypothetical protein
MRPRGLVRPALAVLLAIGITTTMDANGLSAFSALPLLPVGALFWLIDRIPRRSVGYVLGKPFDYFLALLHPLLVFGFLAALALAVGAVHPAASPASRVAFNCFRVAAATFLVVLVTEEGFFRGWLWAALERAGESPARVLAGTSVAFAAWHISAVSLETGFDLPGRRIPLFLVNAAVMGAIWGLLRAVSGSVVVSSAAHGLWNGGAYVLFGFSTHPGKLGIADVWLWGPEVGVLGLAANVVFAAALWRVWRRGSRAPAARGEAISVSP